MAAPTLLSHGFSIWMGVQGTVFGENPDRAGPMSLDIKHLQLGKNDVDLTITFPPASDMVEWRSQ